MIHRQADEAGSPARRWTPRQSPLAQMLSDLLAIISLYRDQAGVDLSDDSDAT
jgi:hypothetical protein